MRHKYLSNNLGLAEQASLVPMAMRKQDLDNMQRPEGRDESVKRAESLTIEWIHAFLDEIYRIEDFFKEKQDELINEFISL